MQPDLQRAINDLLTENSETEAFPFIVTTREDGNLEVSSPDLTRFWVVRTLIADA
jgi:hypothetical protein